MILDPHAQPAGGPRWRDWRTPFYVLEPDGITPKNVDLVSWCQWMEKNECKRNMARDEVAGVVIDTCFLAIASNIHGPPLVFETMTTSRTREDLDGRICRYATHAEAMAGHAAVVSWVKSKLAGEDPPAPLD